MTRAMPMNDRQHAPTALETGLRPVSLSTGGETDATAGEDGATFLQPGHLGGDGEDEAGGARHVTERPEVRGDYGAGVERLLRVDPKVRAVVAGLLDVLDDAEHSFDAEAARRTRANTMRALRHLLE